MNPLPSGDSSKDLLSSVLSALTAPPTQEPDSNKYVTHKPNTTLKDVLDTLHANKELIRELDLKEMAAKNRKLKSSGAALVARVFEINRTVHRLMLPDHEIGDQGAKAMGKMLLVNNNLQQLNLNGNGIAADGAQALGDSLYGHESLEHLNLSNNNIGDDGVKALAQALQFNASVKYLGLANNNIGPEGAEALLETIIKNRALQSVHLVKNNIPTELWGKIRAALVLNRMMANKLKRDEEKEKYRLENRDLVDSGGESSDEDEEDAGQGEFADDDDDESLMNVYLGKSTSGSGKETSSIDLIARQAVDLFAMSASDVDNEAPMMSLDEFKQNMIQSLRDTGTVEMIRAQLRRTFIEKLQQKRREFPDKQEVNHDACVEKHVEQITVEEKLVRGLLVEYLSKQGLENTLAVYIPEIGGQKGHIDTSTILQMLHLSPEDQKAIEFEQRERNSSLLIVLIQELLKRLQVHSMATGTQTAMDCFDHRIVLENQLRRIENAYLAESTAQKLEPSKSIEERMLQYQHEYDALCEKKMQEELERYKTTELALARVEERKRFDRELDTIRSSLFQEHTDKMERLQERERELEMAFVAKRSELETSLFETRQTLFQDMERLRVKEAQLQAKIHKDFEHFSAETKRLMVWEETVRNQEANFEEAVTQSMRTKEQQLQLEKEKLKQELQIRENSLIKRESELQCQLDSAMEDQKQLKSLHEEMKRLEDARMTSESSLMEAKRLIVTLEQQLRVLEVEKQVDQERAKEEKSALTTLSAMNARLTAEKESMISQLDKLRLMHEEKEEQFKQAALEIKDLQQQLLLLKMDEVNAVVNERRRFLKMMDEERERSQWKESELTSKLRDLQSRLAEAEAAAEKYQTQYEDEKLHVETLRHDVANLNALLTQAQMTISAKHGTITAREVVARRGQGNVPSGNLSAESFISDTNNVSRNNNATYVESDRSFMNKMIEMMQSFHGQTASQVNNNIPRQNVENSNQSELSSHQPSSIRHGSPIASHNMVINAEAEEELKLKEDQRRIERELLEQREYERRKQQRMEQEEKELAERRKLFEDELSRKRKEALEEEERQEAIRQRSLAEAESFKQLQAERQRLAAMEATEMQAKLIETQRLLDEKKRLLEEERIRQQAKEEEELIVKQRQLLEDEQLARKKQAEILGESDEKHQIQLEKAESVVVETFYQDVRDEMESRQDFQTTEHVFSESESECSEQDELQETNDDNTKEAESTVETDSLATEIYDDQSATTNKDNIADATTTHEAVPTNVHEINDSSRSEVGSDVTDADHRIADETCNAAPVVSQTPDEIADPEVHNETAQKEPDKLPESPEQEEEKRRKAAEDEKKKQDEDVIDVYRQRVLARKAAEKQKQLELEAAAAIQQKAKEEAAMREAEEQLGEESDHELELSEGSFAESSSESNGPRLALVYRDHSQISLEQSITGNMGKISPENEVRAARRPLPRQLDVSDWSFESPSRSTTTMESNAMVDRSGSEPTRYSSSISCSRATPVNRYDFGVQHWNDWHQSGAGAFWNSRRAHEKLMPNVRSSADPVSRDLHPKLSLQENENQRSVVINKSALAHTRVPPRLFPHSEVYSPLRSQKLDMTPMSTETKRQQQDLGLEFGSGGHDTSHRFTEMNNIKTDAKPEMMQSEHGRSFFSPLRENSDEYSPPNRDWMLQSRELTSKSSGRRLSEVSASIPTTDKSEVDILSQYTRERVNSRSTETSNEELSDSTSIGSPSPTRLKLKGKSNTQNAIPVSNSHSFKLKRMLPQIANEQAMAERRKELYEFRKQMRQAFNRVEKMVDSHRNFFQTDLKTGVPVYDTGLEEEAQQLASHVFEELAKLRAHFRTLTKDVHRATNQFSDERENKQENNQKREEVSSPTNELDNQLMERSYDDNKVSYTQDKNKQSEIETHLHKSNRHSERIGTAESISFPRNSSPRAVSEMSSPSYSSSSEPSPSMIRPFRGADDTLDTESLSSFTSVSNQFNELHAPDIQTERVKSTEKDEIDPFQDFDTRMEEIRSSLNAIAAGRKRSAVQVAASANSEKNDEKAMQRPRPIAVTQSSITVPTNTRVQETMCTKRYPSLSAQLLRHQIQEQEQQRGEMNDNDHNLHNRETKLRQLLYDLTSTNMEA